MGKMTLWGKQRGGRREERAVECRIELQQLRVRQSQQEAFEKDYGFAEAGIQVIVGGVQLVPFEFWLDGGGVVQGFRSAEEGLVQIFNQLQKSGDFMKEL